MNLVEAVKEMKETLCNARRKSWPKNHYITIRWEKLHYYKYLEGESRFSGDVYKISVEDALAEDWEIK